MSPVEMLPDLPAFLDFYKVSLTMLFSYSEANSRRRSLLFSETASIYSLKAALFSALCSKNVKVDLPDCGSPTRIHPCFDL
jgi:hypothetical protein